MSRGPERGCGQPAGFLGKVWSAPGTGSIGPARDGSLGRRVGTNVREGRCDGVPNAGSANPSRHHMRPRLSRSYNLGLPAARFLERKIGGGAGRVAAAMSHISNWPARVLFACWYRVVSGIPCWGVGWYLLLDTYPWPGHRAPLRRSQVLRLSNRAVSCLEGFGKGGRGCGALKSGMASSSWLRPELVRAGELTSGRRPEHVRLRFNGRPWGAFRSGEPVLGVDALSWPGGRRARCPGASR